MRSVASRAELNGAPPRAATAGGWPALPWSWLAAALFGAWAVWLNLPGRPDLPVGAGPEPSGAPPPIAGRPGVLGREYSRIILARPLFEPGRRPVAAPRAAEAQAEVALPRLAGTIIGAGGYRAAMLVPAGGTRPVTVREGDRADGLHILQISPGTILAETAGGRLSLQVSYDAGNPPAPAPAAPGRAAKPTHVPVGVADPVSDPRVREPSGQDE